MPSAPQAILDVPENLRADGLVTAAEACLAEEVGGSGHSKLRNVIGLSVSISFPRVWRRVVRQLVENWCWVWKVEDWNALFAELEVGRRRDVTNDHMQAESVLFL
jgi:hypothetical protein